MIVESIFIYVGGCEMLVKDVVKFMKDNNFDDLEDSDVSENVLELNSDSEVVCNIYEVTTDEAEVVLYFVDSLNGDNVFWGIILSAFVAAEFIDVFNIDFTFQTY